MAPVVNFAIPDGRFRWRGARLDRPRASGHSARRRPSFMKKSRPPALTSACVLLVFATFAACSSKSPDPGGDEPGSGGDEGGGQGGKGGQGGRVGKGGSGGGGKAA